MEHTIKKDGFYSISEILEYKIVSISNRSLQIYAKKNQIRTIDNSYRFTGHQVLELKNKYELRANKRAKNEAIAKLLSEQKKTNAPDVFGISNDSLEAKESSSLLVQINQELKQEIENLKQENQELKEQLTKEIPHQEKLKKAIELITLEAMKQNVTHKVFTEEEYTDIIGTISQVEFHQEQVQYLKSRVEKQDDILNKLASQVSENIAENRERNFITAKEKGFDNSL
jgi:hypothetical protein